MHSAEIIHNEYLKRIQSAIEYHLLAQKYFEMNDIVKALEYYNFAISINPSNSDIYCDRAECFFSLKDNKFFIRDLTYAIITNLGQDIKYWEKRADGFFRIGEPQLAELDKEMIVKLIREQAEKKFAKSHQVSILDVPNASMENLFVEIKDEKTKESEIEKQVVDTSLRAFSNLSKIDRMFLNLKGANLTDILKVYSDEYSIIKDEKLISFEKILKKEVLLIENSDLLTVYAHKNGKVNYAKTNEALRRIEKLIEGKELEVYDWGAGTAFSATVFYDFIKERELDIKVSKLVLIDPSNLTLTRQKVHLKALNANCALQTVNKEFREISAHDFDPSETSLKLHFFSNLLDSDAIDIHLFIKHLQNFKGTNLFLCVSSFNDNYVKIDEFYKILSETYSCRLILNNENTNQANKWRGHKCTSPKCKEHSNDNYICRNNPWTRKELIFTSVIS